MDLSLLSPHTECSPNWCDRSAHRDLIQMDFSAEGRRYWTNVMEVRGEMAKALIFSVDDHMYGFPFEGPAFVIPKPLTTQNNAWV